MVSDCDSAEPSTAPARRASVHPDLSVDRPPSNASATRALMHLRATSSAYTNGPIGALGLSS